MISFFMLADIFIDYVLKEYILSNMREKGFKYELSFNNKGYGQDTDQHVSLEIFEHGDTFHDQQSVKYIRLTNILEEDPEKKRYQISDTHFCVPVYREGEEYNQMNRSGCVITIWDKTHEVEFRPYNPDNNLGKYDRKEDQPAFSEEFMFKLYEKIKHAIAGDDKLIAAFNSYMKDLSEAVRDPAFEEGFTYIGLVEGDADNGKSLDNSEKEIIEAVEKPEPGEQTGEFVITEKSTLREIAEHNPMMFKRLMYAAFGPGWEDYFLWKASVVKDVDEHDNETTDEGQKSLTDIMNEYLEEHKPTEEQIKEDIALITKLSPEELKEIMCNYVMPKIPDDFIIPNLKGEKL